MRALAIVAVLTATAFADTPSPDQLAKDRADAAAKVYPTVLARYKAGSTTFDQVATWSEKWLTASLDVPKANTKQAFADYLARTQDLEKLTTDRVNTGTASRDEADEATYYRIEAQLWAARNKR